MKKLNRMMALLMAMAMLLAVSGYAEEPGGTELELLPMENADVPADAPADVPADIPADEPLPVEGEAAPEPAILTLDPVTATLDYSQSVVLTAFVSAGAESVTWTSSDENVASLSADTGESVEVVGINEGTATITCVSGEQTQTCEVTVTVPETLQITGVDYPATFLLGYGGWKLRNGTVASTVDLATLTTVIKNASGEMIGSSYTHTFDRGVTRFDLREIDGHIPFSKITDEGAYTWTLSATDVNGRSVSMSLPVSAVVEGETTVSSNPGAYSPILFASSLALDRTEIALMKGETTRLNAMVTPSGSVNGTAMWVSDDPSVAVVSTDGELTGVGIGATTVKCWVLGNDAIQASCAITVQGEPAASTDVNREVVASLGMQVERVQGDGVNLLASSGDMNGHLGSGTIDGKYNNFTIEYCDGRGIPEYRDIGTWNGLNLEPNTEYTLSFFMRGSGGAINAYMYPNAVVSGYDSNGATTTLADGMIEYMPTQEWQRYWVVWKTPADVSEAKSIICARCMPGNDTQVWICGAKLEKGNVPTAWTSSPEDGKNLLANSQTMAGHLGSGTEDGTYDDFAVNYCDGREIAEYKDIGTWNDLYLEPNTEYTLSFYMRGSGGAIKSYMYPSAVVSGYDSNGGTTSFPDGMIEHLPTEEWQRYWVVWKTPSDINESKNIICARCMPGNDTQIWICGAKLEKGNIATDWTPAPEDADSSF